ncbi:MAG: Eco57I restriction-modification methylase domain-containing protein [Anaerolineae bacterium]|nr:Eco57I restriction-modification methylase domain-containing protein [Anaerolineae bacterium]
MAAPAQLHELVARFHYNLTDYKQGKYNETQVRREFIDPLLKLLGWDVDNEKGYAEAYKEVVHEDAIKVGGATKAPDYSFRIGGVRKFFLEAKKPSVNIKHDIHPAYQLRRYAWSAKLPLSILTDFEELAIYDGRIKPDKRDGAATARVKYITFDSYVSAWDELVETFSPEAIRRGAFDKYVESTHKKRGTAEVDSAFLQEIERWRDILARNLALRNPHLSQRQLNFAVQHTIDRLIFLRIAEDRGIEPYGQLMALQNGANVYDRLHVLFQRADDRYNSGLFHFKVEKGREGLPDTLTPHLRLDDKVLQDIFKNLYYPDSPYEFSVLPADILGQVYEQFLGKVIRLTSGHRAIVEDKPEVKKAGGVFYTPTYIVNYIVRQTVGRLLEDQTPDRISGRGRSKDQPPLRLVDPACGSGSFLLGAYQFLLDWYRDWYMANEPERWAKTRPPRIYEAGPVAPSPVDSPVAAAQTATINYQLTIDERKQILLTHIFGVDIDPQAVEVTKLSLLLKVLEDEKSVAPQLEMFQQRVLPDLGANIKCGNSLIGSDFYAANPMQMTMFDEDEMYRVNPFDWEAEFPDIFGWGGFDAVIGNPPYVRQEELGESKEYFQSHYKTFRSTADLYVNFIEKGLNLLRTTGLFGMIVSNKWLRAAYGQPLREFLVKDNSVLEVIDFAGLPVFANATVRTIILICANQPNNDVKLRYVEPISLEEFRIIREGSQLIEIVNKQAINLSTASLSPNGWSFSGQNTQDLVERIQKISVQLKIYIQGKTFFGIKTGFNKAFVIDKTIRDKLISENPESAEIIKPVLAGRDVRRYEIDFKDKYLIWTYIGVPIKEKYPAIFKYLKQFQDKLEKRWDKGNYWWELRPCDYYDLFNQPKIIYPDIATNCRFTLDRDGYFSTNTTYFISGDDLYLLGILNSKLGEFYLSEVCAELEGSGKNYLRFFGQYLNDFPVRLIDFDNPADKAKHDQMVHLVEQMLELHRQLAAAAVPQAQTMLKRQIAAADSRINQLVYDLYGLTEAEVAIVEAAAG